MTRALRANARRGHTRIVLSCGSLLAIAGISLTSAAFTDEALVNLGTGAAGSGIGNAHRFDIAVRDRASLLRDAATIAEAVVLPTSGAAQFTEDEAVVFDATFVNRAPGVDGEIQFSLYDPDSSGPGDLFNRLRFTLYLEGSSTPVVANGTAAQVNAAADSAVVSAEQGEEIHVQLEAVIEQGAALAVAGQSTQIGIAAEGESR